MTPSPVVATNANDSLIEIRQWGKYAGQTLWLNAESTRQFIADLTKSLERLEAAEALKSQRKLNHSGSR